MKKNILLIAFFCGTMHCAFSQNTTDWSKFKWLIGEWTGEGGGKPGEGVGWFVLKEDLGGKVLVRTNHSEYPANNGKPAIIHDDLMVLYTDYPGTPSKAIYFDNEGHTINYTISFTENTITFLGEKIPNVPVFRLTYLRNEKDRVTVRFEMSRDGLTFMTYTEGRCKRKIN